MNKAKILFLILPFCLTACAQTEWIEYDFCKYNFAISMYQEPEFSVDSSEFNGSTLFTYFWEIYVEDTLHENSYYSISSLSYPSDFIHSDSLFNVVEGFINSSQFSILNDSTYSLLTSTLFEKNGFPCKVFKWKNNETNLFFEFHVFLVENNLFQLSVVSRLNKNHNSYINKFFDSFKILNTPNGNFLLPKNPNGKTILIEFPENPKELNNTVDSEYGSLQLNIQLLEPKKKNDNIVYMAMETKYPYNVVDQSSVEDLDAFYQKSIEGSLASVNGELISIHDIYYKGILGKEYKSNFSEGKALMVYRIFYVEGNLYSFGVITSPEKDKNNGMQKFFDSFEINK